MATSKSAKRGSVASSSPARRARGAPPARDAHDEVEERPIVVTTVRIYLDQLLALQTMALAHKAAARGGRQDASAVMRKLLDQVLPERKGQPDSPPRDKPRR